MTEKTPRLIWETIADDLAKKCDAALQLYRSGEDRVVIEFGGLAIRLTDRKDNDNRETIRMTMEEFLTLVGQCHVNGAAMATTIAANVLARMSGFVLLDADAASSEAPGT